MTTKKTTTATNGAGPLVSSLALIGARVRLEEIEREAADLRTLFPQIEAERIHRQQAAQAALARAAKAAKQREAIRAKLRRSLAAKRAYKTRREKAAAR